MSPCDCHMAFHCLDPLWGEEWNCHWSCTESFLSAAEIFSPGVQSGQLLPAGAPATGESARECRTYPKSSTESNLQRV